MNDPYAVLGLTPDATEAQIKNAYRSLAKQASSLPADMAKQRMTELDRAYDMIITRKINNSDYTSSDSDYDRCDYYASSKDYSDIRRLIIENRLDDADLLLNGIPQTMRDAQWHFLKGQILYKKGRLEAASNEFETAYRMEPSNNEYRSMYEDIYSKRSGGYRKRAERGGCSGCDICTGLIFADCCCESMGGDLIPCC